MAREEAHKLGLGIVVHGDTEFIEDIIRCAGHAASSTVIYMYNVSYNGSEELPPSTLDFVSELKERLKDEYEIESKVIELEEADKNAFPSASEAESTEVAFYNKCREDLLARGCDYFLLLQDDEMVSESELKYGLSFMSGCPQFDCSYCTGLWYYKDMLHYITNEEQEFNFISKTTTQFTYKKFCASPKVTYEVEFTRQFESDRSTEFRGIVVHKFFMVSSDIANKVKRMKVKTSSDADIIHEYNLFDDTTHYVEHCLPHLVGTEKYYISKLTHPLIRLSSADPTVALVTDYHRDMSQVRVCLNIISDKDLRERDVNALAGYCNAAIIRHWNLETDIRKIIAENFKERATWTYVVKASDFGSRAWLGWWAKRFYDIIIAKYNPQSKKFDAYDGHQDDTIKIPFVIKCDPKKIKITDNMCLYFEDTVDYCRSYHA